MLKNKKIILVFFVFLVILAIMQFTVQQIIGFDGYLHVKAADVIKQEGFIKEFPWAENTILAGDYADIHILFRILLIPFTFFGLELGAKLASVFFGAICFTVFYWFLIENKIKFAFFWSLLYLFTAESLMYRFLLTRQMPLAIALLVLTIYFLQKRKYFFLGLSSFVFVLFYSGFVFQFFIIFLYLILTLIFSKKFEHHENPLKDFQDAKKGKAFFVHKVLLYSLIGFVLGLLVHPNFPNNILMFYTQIFKVNLIANLYNVEWRAWPFFEFLKNNVFVIFYFVVSIVFLVKNKKLNKNKLFYVLLALFFLGFTLKSRRMQEYLVPFSILMFVFVLRDFVEKIDKNKFYKFVKTGAVVFIIFLMVFNLYLLRKDVVNNSFLHNYDNCAEWMKESVPNDSLVFINAYAFPYLFFKNSDLRYTHGMDLTYSYLYDAEKFERYIDILKGTIKGKKDWIVEDYSPDYLFAGKVKQDVKLFEYIVEHKEDYKIEFEDEWCAVLKVK